LPESFDASKAGGVGFRLIRSLADKLGATLTIESDSLGLTFRLLFPAAL
jgi:two-component sensor histidine kinase